MDPAEAQLVAMALAHLAHERPGWEEMTRGVAKTLEAEALFDRFLAFRRAHVPDPRDGDSILDIRRQVERVNPALWAMVAEICWPGGREG